MLNLRCMVLRVISVVLFEALTKIALQNDQEVPQKVNTFE